VQRDLAHLQHVAVVGYLERGTGVLLDQQDGDAGAAQALDHLEHLGDDTRRQPQAGLVQHQQFGTAHQRAPHGQHLAFAARQRPGQLAAPFVQPAEHGVDLVQRVHARAVAQPHLAKGAQDEVVFHRHAGEQLALLGYQRDAQHGPVLQAHVGDVPVFVPDAAARAHRADQRVEQGRLARAVGADHGHDRASFGPQGDAVQDLGPSVARVQVGDVQQCLVHALFLQCSVPR